MNEFLARYVKEKIYSYIKGDSTIPELYKWASERKEFARAIPHIKDKSDIVFFLMGQAGLETRNFYIEKKLTIKREGIIKNFKKIINGEITSDDLHNWADDVLNWELIEGCQDDITQATLEHLAEDSQRLKSLSKEDYDNLIWQLEKSQDPKHSISRFNLIFCLPRLKEILLSKEDVKTKISKINSLKKYFLEESFFRELLEVIRIFLNKEKSSKDWDRFFNKVSRGTSPRDLLTDTK